MKRLITCLFVAILLAVCPACTQGEKNKYPEIDGYSFAVYNSDDESDNELENTSVYIVGKVLAVTDATTLGDDTTSIMMSIKSVNEEDWIVIANVHNSKDIQQLLEGKEVKCFGRYQGYSRVFLNPVIGFEKVIVDDETYTLSDLRNIVKASNADGDKLSSTEKSTEKPTEKSTEKPTKKPTEPPTEAPTENKKYEPTQAPKIEDTAYKEFQNALKKAENYSETLHMSKQSIYEQLTSEYGEKFPQEAAQYAIDNMQADWNYNALKKAESYNETMHMSKQGLYDQLVSEYGEKFTASEAQYAVDSVNANWNENALEKARNYQSTLAMSKDAIYNQLISEYGEKFTESEAQYAVNNL